MCGGGDRVWIWGQKELSKQSSSKAGALAHRKATAGLLYANVVFFQFRGARIPESCIADAENQPAVLFIKKLKKMTTVNLNNLELNEFIARDDSTQHCLATFPLVGAHGSKKIATVYFELLPGECLGSHIDSAEELLVILSGDVEITIGGETAQASASTVALVPEQVPHDIRNIGTSKVRVLGVFGGVNHIVATFENIWLPTQSRIVNTAELFEA